MAEQKQKRPPNRHSPVPCKFPSPACLQIVPHRYPREKNACLRFPATIRKFAFHLLKKGNRCLLFVHHVSYVVSHVIEKIEQKQKGKRVLVARDNDTRCAYKTQVCQRSGSSSWKFHRHGAVSRSKVSVIGRLVKIVWKIVVE